MLLTFNDFSVFLDGRPEYSESAGYQVRFVNDGTLLTSAAPPAGCHHRCARKGGKDSVREGKLTRAAKDLRNRGRNHNSCPRYSIEGRRGRAVFRRTLKIRSV